MQKLNRKQIRETLESVPLDTLLLGTQAKERTLTHKQKEFARMVAMGDTKAQAYRKAYNSKTDRAKTQGDAGSRLSKQAGISAEIDAYRLAMEASKHRTPAQLREFVIHQLTLHAMNEDINPAQRIKSLELLGKVSEVAAFTERKETTVINQSSDIKARLMSMLSNTIDITPNSVSQPNSSDDADDLLLEIKGEGMSDSGIDTPTTTTPPLDALCDGQETTHTIPHKKSIEKSVPCSTSPVQVLDIVEDLDATLTSYSCFGNKEDVVIDEKVIKEGVGGVENVGE